MPKQGLTPLAVFLAEELDRRNWSQLDLENRSGIPDSTIGRIRAGQEPKPSQVARLAKALGYKFWYVMQRAGYAPDAPDDPSAEAQRLGALFADDAELRAFVESVLRLSPANRRAVMQMTLALLDPPSAPEGE